MNAHRAGEHNTPVPFRRGCHFNINAEWYFEARGGEQKGPFESKLEMQAELLLFIRNSHLELQTLSS